MAINPFFDHYQHLRSFTDAVLRDLARNEAAPRDYRKYAVELLINRRSPYARHEDLKQFVSELEAEMDGIQLEYPAPDPGPGPLKASVTTATMFGQEEVVDNRDKFSGFDDVQLMDEPIIVQKTDDNPPAEEREKPAPKKRGPKPKKDLPDASDS